MKAQVRVLGVDDGPFAFSDATVPVVGVVMRGGAYVEAVLRNAMTVDGDDATDVLARMIAGSRHREGLRAVLLDGVTYAGFNVVDVPALAARAGVAVVAVTRGAPDLAAMRAALAKRFPDAWRPRWERLARAPPFEIPTATTPLYATASGMDRAEVAELLARTTVRGLVPEPLRLAHLVATAFARGESRGQ